MKIVFCVEDDSDRVLYSSMIERILGNKVEIERFAMREEGLELAIKLAPIVALQALHHGADAAVFAIDNDDGPFHSTAHDERSDSKCHYCRLAHAVNAPGLARKVADYGKPFSIILAVPVPTIETWLLVADGYPFAGPPEAQGKGSAGRKQLKQALYHCERPDRETRLERARPLIDKLDVSAVSARSESFRHFVAQLKKLRPPV